MIFLVDHTPGLCRGDQPVAGGLGCAGFAAPAEIQKVEDNVEAILWLNMRLNVVDTMALSDDADRYASRCIYDIVADPLG